MAGFSNRSAPPVEIAMVAHPSVTVLVDLSEGEGFVHDAQGRRERGSFVVGLLPGELRMGGRIGAVLQIRLGPVAAAAVLGSSAELRDISGLLVPFADVWGRDAGRAEERLRAAASWDERFTVARDLLARRLYDDGPRARPPVDPEVAFVWRQTLGRRGRVRVDGLADEAGWSRKRLSARFRSQLGITPKRAARLVRFDHAAHLLAAGRDAAAVAAESGYVDQSHLHREVREFTGLTPRGVAAAPWLAIDDVPGRNQHPPGPPPTRRSGKGVEQHAPTTSRPQPSSGTPGPTTQATLAPDGRSPGTFGTFGASRAAVVHGVWACCSSDPDRAFSVASHQELQLRAVRRRQRQPDSPQRPESHHVML